MHINNIKLLTKTSKTVALFCFIICLFIQSTYSQEQDEQIEIRNTTSFVVKGIYIITPDQPNWGDNWIEMDILPDERIPFPAERFRSCIYDVKVVFDNGYEIDYSEIDFCFEPVFIIE